MSCLRTPPNLVTNCDVNRVCIYKLKALCSCLNISHIYRSWPLLLSIGLCLCCPFGTDSKGLEICSPLELHWKKPHQAAVVPQQQQKLHQSHCSPLMPRPHHAALSPNSASKKVYRPAALSPNVAKMKTHRPAVGSSIVA